MYAEHVKAKQGYLDVGTKRVLEVYIPSFSVCALLGVTGYITSDAISVIMNNDSDDDVNVYFMYAFACGNFVVDVISVGMFYWRGREAFANATSAPTIRSFSIDGHANIPLEGESGTGSEEKEKEKEWNLNMLSAITHVAGDTMRTMSVFVAAVISSAAGVDADICDAWAAIVVSITIVIAVIPLVVEIVKAVRRDF